MTHQMADQPLPDSLLLEHGANVMNDEGDKDGQDRQAKVGK